MVYLPVKFRCGSVHVPWRYSPRNPDICLISHYGVHIFSGSFLRYCCRSPLCPALRTASPRVPVHCLAYLPSLLPQSPLFSVSTFSLSVLHQGRTLVILGLLSRLKSHLWSSLCPLSPQPMVPSSQIQILAMSIFLCRLSHFPGCIEFSTLSASLLSDSILQHHDSYIPTLECY